MSTFLYPRDLYRSLRKVWNASPFTKGWPPVELPEQKTLNQLLDVCYHASFLVEESRPVTFRAVFLEHTTPLKPLEADQSHPTELYLFVSGHRGTQGANCATMQSGVSPHGSPRRPA